MIACWRTPRISAPARCFCGFVRVGARALVAAGAVARPGVAIGADATVAPGAAVARGRARRRAGRGRAGETLSEQGLARGAAPCTLPAMHPLDPLLRPRSIAIVGASDDPTRIGGRPIAYMPPRGFAGAICR